MHCPLRFPFNQNSHFVENSKSRLKFLHFFLSKKSLSRNKNLLTHRVLQIVSEN